LPSLITYAALRAASGAVDAENDTLVFLITRVNRTAGYLYVKPSGATAALPVSANTVHVGPGDVLAFVPLTTGELNPFNVRVSDNTSYAANESSVYQLATASPVVSVTTTGIAAWEGNAGHPGTLTLARTGDVSLPLTVRLMPIDNNPDASAGGALKGTTYKIVYGGSDTDVGAPRVATTVTIPAGEATLDLRVQAIEDSTIDTELQQAGVILLADNPASPEYVPSTTAWTAGVNIIDSAPKLSIAAAAATIQEGTAAPAFIVTRTAAPGGALDTATDVNITFTGSTFSLAHLMNAPTSVHFDPGETTKVVTLFPADDGAANGSLTLSAAISKAGFQVLPKTATIKVLDGSPTITITKAGTSIAEGFPTQAAFVVTRTPAAGRTLDSETFVGVSYTGSTFPAANIISAPGVVYFDVGESSKTLYLTLADNGIAESGKTVAATIAGTGINISGSKTATVTVTDASPTITLTPSATAVQEGLPNQVAFLLTRTPAAGTSLAGV
jgi:hypothetical protein